MGWHPEEWRARSLDETAPKVHHLYAYGPTPDAPAAVAALEVTRDDNLHWIRGDLFVEPTQRRRGYGTAVLGELESQARRLERASLLINVIEGAHEIGAGPNRPFAQARGYRVAEENVRRDLAWPRPNGELSRLWDDWSPHAYDYEIVTWTEGRPRSSSTPVRTSRRSCQPRRRTSISTSSLNDGTRSAFATTRRPPIEWGVTSSSPQRDTE